jgi:hypothetical protein
VKKKKSKKPNDKPSVTSTSSSGEKEHVKVVIKKTKKEVKVLANDGEKPAQKAVSKDVHVKEKTKDSQVGKAYPTTTKTAPKKKSKTSESPKSGEKEVSS